MTLSAQRVQATADFLKKTYEEALQRFPAGRNPMTTDPVELLIEAASSLHYRYKHSLRVAHYGKILALAEGGDVEQAVVGCLLHDLSYFHVDMNDKTAWLDHGRSAGELARPFLETLGYSAAETLRIVHAIAVHVDDKAGFEHPETLESKIVSDADNLDRFGAQRLLIFAAPHLKDYASLCCHAERQCQYLKQYLAPEFALNPPTGTRLFLEQVKKQLAVHEDTLREAQLVSVPELGIGSV